jgi:hypothetical protein
MTKALHYKDDSTFSKYLAMAAFGEAAAIRLMAGHDFALDGYGAGSSEIWKDVTKKQKRTADLVCKRCGQKLEVRAKGALGIKMSDSAARPFDKELRPNDWVGFLRVSREAEANAPNEAGIQTSSLVASDYLYVISVGELTRTKSLAVRSFPKTKDKGSESYLTWPSLLAPASGTLSRIDREERAIFLDTDYGSTIKLDPPEHSYPYNHIKVGHRVSKNETLICGVARTVHIDQLQCRGA